MTNATAAGAAAIRPTRIRLRPWQSEALDALTLKQGPDFLAVATPGAGKTTFALTAAVQDLGEHPGRRVVVVAPTQHLKHQWADAALRFGLHLDPEWSARDGILPPDMHGIVTTYQQVSTSAAASSGRCRTQPGTPSTSSTRNAPRSGPPSPSRPPP